MPIAFLHVSIVYCIYIYIYIYIYVPICVLFRSPEDLPSEVAVPVRDDEARPVPDEGTEAAHLGLHYLLVISLLLCV